MPERPPLRDMTPAELIDWLGSQQAELEEFCTFAQQYIKRRERRGYQTVTDDRYERFFTQAADLIRGLAEMREMAQDGKGEQL